MFIRQLDPVHYFDCLSSIPGVYMSCNPTGMFHCVFLHFREAFATYNANS